ncbi:MAG: PPE family protein, partial [Mycobacterium sp.]|nr:PPE family protein [Mycobacterium sp.]
YAEMWAQDAATMYGYAAASAAATVLAPFQQPPQTADPAGRSAQAAAVTEAVNTPAGQTRATVAQLLAALPQRLHALATGAGTNTPAAGPATALTSPSILTAFADFNALSGPINPAWNISYMVFSAGRFGTGYTLLSRQLAKGERVNPAFRAGETLPPPDARGPVLARLGTAAPVGKLSVPQSWVTANAADPSNGPVVLEHTGFQAAPAATGAQPVPNMLGGMPKGRSETSGSFVLRNGRRRFQMPRPLYGG